ncbi:PREDICTED: calreticulin isoform X2 [Nicrophorus vespilloides]|uniref:Calreticulin n=1 Tax=Nicrophorus vespilloides TaxID=110193 RepID=A0ABM1M7H0_NICVS|nr:PREDICTED: calreticulin isoform X2 [Nicrophorus vespilloides]
MKGIAVVSALLALLCVAHAGVFLDEKFDDDSWESNWVYSKHPGKEFGKFVRTAGKFFNEEEADKGLQTSEDARFYALSRKFEPFSTEGKDLVIQFSVKHEQNIDCGGGYVKVFDCSLKPEEMHGESPYRLMFGPDICGPGTKKVHVILNYKEKNVLINKDIRCKDDVYTHVYTLIVKPDNTYEVQIDGEKVEGGDLEADWDLLPAKKIKDPEASKPDDWDDREMLPDPEDTKPEDWDKPEHIADPDATKPDDWDDEMDGEWEPPQIDNPEYKGEWAPKQIKNPVYKGPWVHPEVDNPDYSPDSELYKHDEICGIGFDLWQVKSGTIFDNVLITDDVEYAKTALAGLKATQDGEKVMKEEQDKVEREAAAKEEEEKKEDAVDEDDEEEEEEEDKVVPVHEDHDEL